MSWAVCAKPALPDEHQSQEHKADCVMWVTSCSSCSHPGALQCTPWYPDLAPVWTTGQARGLDIQHLYIHSSTTHGWLQVSQLLSLQDTRVQDLVQELEALRAQAQESSAHAQVAEAEAQHSREELAAHKVGEGGRGPAIGAQNSIS
jgi:hypothetical protein